ncbi:MAG: hypothetical protein HRJ53_24355 [Acidobacteria bacterium Pan2503]|uniref:Isoprenylcysteine carboxyl methyltransferase n=1 Tax=Candidatus Acidiferrum panamense TaxID=2741543 RepID=A0A7V8NV68_9BACT|nr:hypothetical protein [Candidatus Acidoferrum panamensis]
MADGPYRHVRNPLYLGTFLMSTGLGFLANRSGFVVLAAGAAIRILRLIGREEAELEKQQGQQQKRLHGSSVMRLNAIRQAAPA